MKKQFSKKITTTYRWWRCDSKAIKPAHEEFLEERAMERIQEMMKQGYVSGSLDCRVDGAEADSINYQGWWETKTETE